MDERLDKFLVKKGYFESRNRAQREIKAGNIKIDSKVCKKKSFPISEENQIEISGIKCKYVSRAGLKLKNFLDSTNIILEGNTVLDIGSSTGGFVEVMLEKNAAKIYAVDVGTNQLHPKLLANEKVLSFESTDIRDYLKENDSLYFDLITADLSFIPLEKIIPDIKNRADKFIFLYKPQFETPKKLKNKHGVIKDLNVHVKYLKKFVDFLYEIGFNIKKIKKSDLKGCSGNQEYFFYCLNDNPAALEIKKIKKEVFS
ncbi:MAG: TlyA family RNA methyltransferase [Candidatus Mcinerneyibacterium aminivorans]|uniref:TlyA family RNA methyltransferase n=1 Tax=Candidatus Mcinerneyibacterium aminivorans TaxID=2703815 RepID=A0A5D0MAL6_9BACT|nr:MAG: TlyA family RNA methyltransferase [Candidatus Mcinerneyibacterium aminivorans]